MLFLAIRMAFPVRGGAPNDTPAFLLYAIVALKSYHTAAEQRPIPVVYGAQAPGTSLARQKRSIAYTAFPPYALVALKSHHT